MWSASQFSRLAAGHPRSSTSLVTGPADAPSFPGYGCSFRFPSRLHGAELPRPAAFCLTCAFLHRPQTEFAHFPVFRTRRGGRARFFIAAVLRFWVEGPCFVIARPRKGPWQSRRIGCGFWQAEANPKPASRDSHVTSLLGITRPGKLTNAPPQWDGALCRPVISKTVRSGAAFPHRLHASPAGTAEEPALPAPSPPGR